MSDFDLPSAIGVAVAFLVGLSGHEFLTHLLASARGDRAPRFQKRLTPNLRAHVDPLGTIVLPILFTVLVFLRTPGLAFLFAYCRSHAIAPPARGRSPIDSIVVPFAGPIWTCALAVIAGRTLASIGLDGGALSLALAAATITLIDLTVLELIPIPGRDGGRVLAAYLSPRGAYRMEELRQYEALFLVALFIFVPGAISTLEKPFLTLAGLR